MMELYLVESMEFELVVTMVVHWVDCRVDSKEKLMAKMMVVDWVVLMA